MLTPREEQIVELTAWGASAKEIASSLHVSTLTIQNHIHNAKLKLNLQKSTEIAAYFFCNKFHISMDLSPLKKRFGSIAMILLNAFEVFNFDASTLRARCCKITRKIINTQNHDSSFRHIKQALVCR